MVVEVRSTASRSTTREAGRTTTHGFSFGAHYDPGNVGFGPLLAHNDERLPPGTGYPEHRHAGVEIVSVVLAGALRHASTVGSAVLGPGDVQRLSAGTGVVHAETAEHPDEETRFVQTWLRSTAPDAPPSYARATPGDATGLVPLVGGDGPVSLAADARLLRLRLDPGDGLDLPAGRLHVYVVRGGLRIGDGSARLGPGDEARLTDEPPPTAIATATSGPSEALLWLG